VVQQGRGGGAAVHLEVRCAPRRRRSTSAACPGCPGYSTSILDSGPDGFRAGWIPGRVLKSES
jgi:hypothetical protein